MLVNVIYRKKMYNFSYTTFEIYVSSKSVVTQATADGGGVVGGGPPWVTTQP